MILTEKWVRTKLRYWCILQLSMYILILTALVTSTFEVDHRNHFMDFITPLYILTGFVLFLVCTEFCNLAGLSGRNTCLITFWQVVFIVLIGLIFIGAIIGLIMATTGLIYQVIYQKI